MRYRKFTIKNYKGINKVDIDFSEDRIITLVGLNESGKTTIMEAIHLFYQMIRGNDPKAANLKEMRPKGVGFSKGIIIEGTLELEDVDRSKLQAYWKNDLKKRTKLEIPETFSYTYKFKYEADTHKETKKLCGFNIRTSSSKKQLSVSSNGDWQKIVEFSKKELVPEILYYDDFIFEIPREIQFIKSGAPESVDFTIKDKKLNEDWQLALDDILRSTNDSFDSFQRRVVDMWDDDRSLAEQHLEQMEGKLNDVITKRWKDLFFESGKKLNFENIKLSCEPDGNYINVSFKVTTTTRKSFRIDERSKGCKWFFSFLLFTEFRKRRTKNILFLLDEPASNLHSSAQIKITDALNELSKESLVIYATHSHHLIKVEWLSGAYVIINEILEDGLDGSMTFDDKADITAMGYFNYVGSGKGDDKTSYFQPILDALDYQPSQVEPIPNICITEGKNDWYTFQYFQKVILKEKELIHFYPGAGATKLDDIIRLYLAWGKHFIVVVDGDREGKNAIVNYKKEFGEVTDNKLYTLEETNSLVGATEKLISDEDKKKLTKAALGSESTSKKVVNQSINKLLIAKQQVQLSKATKDNFKKLFKFVNEKLNQQAV
jgi:predicted ATPase